MKRLKRLCTWKLFSHAIHGLKVTQRWLTSSSYQTTRHCFPVSYGDEIPTHAGVAHGWRSLGLDCGSASAGGRAGRVDPTFIYGSTIKSRSTIKLPPRTRATWRAATIRRACRVCGELHEDIAFRIRLESEWSVNYGNGVVSKTNCLDSKHPNKIIEREQSIRLNEFRYLNSLKSELCSMQTQVQGTCRGTPPWNAFMITYRLTLHSNYHHLFCRHTLLRFTWVEIDISVSLIQ